MLDLYHKRFGLAGETIKIREILQFRSQFSLWSQIVEEKEVQRFQYSYYRLALNYVSKGLDNNGCALKGGDDNSFVKSLT